MLELDACLTGLGAVWGCLVYHLSIPEGFQNMGIVHLEMVKILLAVRMFAKALETMCTNQRRQPGSCVSFTVRSSAGPFSGRMHQKHLVCH